MSISALSAFLGYNDHAVAEILQFLARTFLEQDAADPRLKFRESSYNNFIEVLGWEKSDEEKEKSATGEDLKQGLRKGAIANSEHTEGDESDVEPANPADTGSGKSLELPEKESSTETNIGGIASQLIAQGKKIDIMSIVVSHMPA
jgi:hypothetical protein